MPLEAGIAADPRAAASIGRAYVAEAARTLQSSLQKIEHCLDQLTDADLRWRAHESHNSIQNIMLHLCGNVRQWVIQGVVSGPDDRRRAQEFSDRAPYSKDELRKRLRETVAEAAAVLNRVADEQLLEPRRIQGFETTVLAAVFDSVSHFVGHTHQIVYISRLRLGDAYRFQWTPTTAEQGAR